MERLKEATDYSRNDDKIDDKIELGKLGLYLQSPRDIRNEDRAEEDSFLEKAKSKSKAKVVSAWNNVKYGMFSLQDCCSYILDY